jgi:hypothetical protein
MGSVNSYPLSKNIPTKKQKPGTQTEEKIFITILTNSIYYFIQCVYIMKLKDSYRLIAIHQRHTLCDQAYPTLRGAQIAFGRLFHRKTWAEQIKPNWSLFYSPDPQWYKKITPAAPPKQSPRGKP